MILLVLNCGSSSLKFQLLAVEAAEEEAPRRLARGLVERIGRDAACTFRAEGGEEARREQPVADHGEALRLALEWLFADVLAEGPAAIAAVGHRVVHGGERFSAPTLIDDEVLAEVEALSALAPLHNPACAAGIRAARAALPGKPMAAVFDTAYYRSLPPAASIYALPAEWTERHRLRRYGFHGIAHEHSARRAAALLGRGPADTRVVSLHLGNGCSATASRGGRAVETSMGFTPLEGLVMGTRAGDLDPSLVPHLMRAEGLDAEEVVRRLNERSGLRGVSGRSNDMRDLLAAAAEDRRAALAVDLFCHRARKYLGAYLAVLEGAEAVVFSGGIGEHAAEVRARVAGGFAWAGLVLDEAANRAPHDGERRISTPGSAVAALVVPSDEERSIALETARLAGGG